MCVLSVVIVFIFMAHGHGLADCAFTSGRHVASSTTALRVTVIIAAAKSTEPSMA